MPPRAGRAGRSLSAAPGGRWVRPCPSEHPRAALPAGPGLRAPTSLRETSGKAVGKRRRPARRSRDDSPCPAVPGPPPVVPDRPRRPGDSPVCFAGSVSWWELLKPTPRSRTSWKEERCTTAPGPPPAAGRFPLTTPVSKWQRVCGTGLGSGPPWHDSELCHFDPSLCSSLEESRSWGSVPMGTRREGFNGPRRNNGSVTYRICV